jgi:hypothetical protein
MGRLAWWAFVVAVDSLALVALRWVLIALLA